MFDAGVADGLANVDLVACLLESELLAVVEKKGVSHCLEVLCGLPLDQ